MSEVYTDDRVYPLTRWVAAAVIPFLLLAFVILYFLPGQTARFFAWEINPAMTAMFMGAGYVGGAYFFARALTGGPWHTVAAGFPGVAAFTWSMLAATVIHWDRFDKGHFAFQVWLVLYVLTPIVIPLIWLRNRRADPGWRDPDLEVPLLVRAWMAAMGLGFLILWIFFFVNPAGADAFWPWSLSPLTARVLGGWFSLLGVGGLFIARERRWSAWRVGFISIGLWQVLVLVAALLNLSSFDPPTVFNWYLVVVALGVLGMLVVYLVMEGRRRRQISAETAPPSIG